MNSEIQDNKTNHGRSFLMGLITGSALGAGLAIYCAPRMASELRQRVTASATGFRNGASDGVQAVANRVADVVERVAGVADDVTRRGQAARDDVADVVAHGAHEVGRDAREVEQFAMASNRQVGSTNGCGRSSRWLHNSSESR